MKLFCVLFIFVFVSELGFCQSRKADKPDDDEVIIVEQRNNKKYNLTATFHGVNFRYGENNEISEKTITYIVFRDNNSSEEVRYKPSTQNNIEDGVAGIVTPNFYFTDIWSPDEEYLVLPIGKIEGFGIFKVKDGLGAIKENKYFDTIKVKLNTSGWFWHDFGKWEDNSIFSFRAGLDGDMFAYKYNLEKKELYCYQEGCEKQDIGSNNKSKIKAIKKGDIEPTKVH